MNLLWKKNASYLSLQTRLDHLIFLLENGVVKLSGDAFLQERINSKWPEISLKELYTEVIFK